MEGIPERLHWPSRARLLKLMLLGLTLLAAGLAATPASAKNPGDWTQADVNAGVSNGLTFIDSLIDKSDMANIHWDASGQAPDVANTGLAIAAFGSANAETPGSIPAAQQADVDAAIQWLIKQQDPGPGPTAGSWGPDSNYLTSIALMALSFYSGAPGAADAIAKGRQFEIAWQNAPPAVTGNPSSTCDLPSGGSYGNCGSWTYSPTNACCGDMSNTGFGVTGLDFSGGVPTGTAAQNALWARASQEVAQNPYATQTDGGGSYEPGETYEPFRSNANDTGTILFSFAYDGISGADPGPAAAMAFGNGVLDEYELMKGGPFPGTGSASMIMHIGTGPTPAPCVIGSGGCEWHYADEFQQEGGYHYSLFALSKGFGSYVVPNLADPTNFYAKVVDLLLGQQGSDGSWPADLRDDGSDVGAASFAILALTKAGQALAHPPAPAPTTTPAAKPPKPKVGVAGVRRACASKAFSLRFNVATSSSVKVKRVTVKLDGKKVQTTTKSSFRLRIRTKKLKAGRHRLTITAVDTAGNVTTVRRTFSVCKAVKPRRKVAPRFTG